MVTNRNSIKDHGMLRNTDDRYGLPAITLHWIMAALMIGL